MSERWKAGELIRNKQTGKPFLVLHVQRMVCTLMTDAEVSEPQVIVLLSKRYDEFATDHEMELLQSKEDKEYTDTWAYAPIVI